MNCLIVLLLLCHYFVENGTAEHEKYRRTIHGYDPPVGGGKTFIIERNFENEGHSIQKRSIVDSDDSKIIQKVITPAFLSSFIYNCFVFSFTSFLLSQFCLDMIFSNCFINIPNYWQPVVFVFLF